MGKHHQHNHHQQQGVVTHLPHARSYGQTLHYPPISQTQDQITSGKYTAGEEFHSKLSEKFLNKAEGFVTKTNYDGKATEYRYETFTQRDHCGRAYPSRYLFVNEDGQLKEFKANGRIQNGQSQGEWVERKDIAQFFLSGDKVYDEKGKIVGELALDPKTNRNLTEKNENFIKGSGIFKSNSGQICCFNGESLTLNGQAAVVRVGLPPKVEMEAVFEKTTSNTVIIDSPRCASGGAYANGGPAYKYSFRLKDTSQDLYSEKNYYGSEITASIEQGKKISIDVGLGKKQDFHVVKSEGDYIYLAEQEGGHSSIRLKKNNSYADISYNVERLSRAKTTYYSDTYCRDLAYANVGWVKGETIYTRTKSPNLDPFI